MPVQAVGRDVQLAAVEPARERRLPVEHAVPAAWSTRARCAPSRPRTPRDPRLTGGRGARTRPRPATPAWRPQEVGETVCLHARRNESRQSSPRCSCCLLACWHGLSSEVTGSRTARDLFRLPPKTRPGPSRSPRGVPGAGTLPKREERIGAFGAHLDGAVQPISNPTGQPQPTAFPPSRGAKTHALDTSANHARNRFTPVRSHRLTVGRRPTAARSGWPPAGARAGSAGPRSSVGARRAGHPRAPPRSQAVRWRTPPAPAASAHRG